MRGYAAGLGRWHSQDPLAEKYYGLTPFGYCFGNPVNVIDPDGRDGVFIAFPDYKISTPVGKLGNLGHAGVLLINNKSGETKYYEYGRYDKDGKGEVRNIMVPDVEIGSDGRPTKASLNKTMEAISEKAGQKGRIEGAFIESDKFKEMKEYAESRMKDNNNPDRKEYSLTGNNCGTFAADVLKQDPVIKGKAPSIVDRRPNSMVKEYQEKFKPFIYIPRYDGIDNE